MVLIITIGLIVWKKDWLCQNVDAFSFLCPATTPTAYNTSPSSPSYSETPTPCPGPSNSNNNNNNTDKGSGTIKLSNYWVARAGDKYLLDCGSSKPQKPESKKMFKKEVALNSGAKKYKINNIPMDAYMWDACYCEGTCQINGKTLNLISEGKNPKFRTISGLHWGIGDKENELEPFVSITADKQYPHGTKLFISALKDVQLPSGKKHNGCVRVDDFCGDGCVKNQMDFHVGTFDNYKKLENILSKKVSVKKDPSCVIQKYI